MLCFTWVVFFQRPTLLRHARTGEVQCDADYDHTKRVYDAIEVSPMTQDKKTVRILCYVLTSSAFHHTACRAIQRTWGSRCDRLVFASDVANEKLGAVVIPHTEHDYDSLWQKHRRTLKYLHETYGQDFDWFLKADTDTYVIVENLRQHLTSLEVMALVEVVPLSVGRRFVLPASREHSVFLDRDLLLTPNPHRLIYNSGGAGYAFNRLYLETFMANFNTEGCVLNPQVPEDFAFGFCMAREAQVFPRVTRDAQDRERFHAMNPRKVWNGAPYWLASYQVGLGGPLSGLDAFAKDSISFHYMTVDAMEYAHAQLYQCRL